MNINYEYDLNDNILKKLDLNDGSHSETFTYDDLDRLITASSTVYGSKSYAYDELNNIISKDGRTYSYENTKPHAVKNDSRYLYTYDANGNMVTRSNGDETRTITYDYENRVKNISDGGSFSYDGMGSRAKKLEKGVTTYYFSPKYEETYEGEIRTNATKYYFANGNRVAEWSTKGGLLYYHKDHLGSSVRITDSSATLTLSIGYMPFGEEAYKSGIASTKYQFNDKEKDASGLINYGSRLYDPELGRFITADTVLDSLNRYTYAYNNPLKYIDPTGNTCSKPMPGKDKGDKTPGSDPSSGPSDGGGKNQPSKQPDPPKAPDTPGKPNKGDSKAPTDGKINGNEGEGKADGGDGKSDEGNSKDADDGESQPSNSLDDEIELNPPSDWTPPPIGLDRPVTGSNSNTPNNGNAGKQESIVSKIISYALTVTGYSGSANDLVGGICDILDKGLTNTAKRLRELATLAKWSGYKSAYMSDVRKGWGLSESFLEAAKNADKLARTKFGRIGSKFGLLGKGLGFAGAALMVIDTIGVIHDNGWGPGLLRGAKYGLATVAGIVATGIIGGIGFIVSAPAIPVAIIGAIVGVVASYWTDETFSDKYGW